MKKTIFALANHTFTFSYVPFFLCLNCEERKFTMCLPGLVSIRLADLPDPIPIGFLCGSKETPALHLPALLYSSCRLWSEWEKNSCVTESSPFSSGFPSMCAAFFQFKGIAVCALESSQVIFQNCYPFSLGYFYCYTFLPLMQLPSPKIGKGPYNQHYIRSIFYNLTVFSCAKRVVFRMWNVMRYMCT